MTYNREDDELVRGKQALHCVNCNKPTFLRSTTYGAAMCSLECDDEYDGITKNKEANVWYTRLF